MKNHIVYLVFCFAFVSLFSINSFGNSPTTFIPNQGQWEGSFQFKAEFSNLAVYTESFGFTYVLSEEFEHHHDEDNHHVVPDIIRKHAFRLRFQNANEISFKGENQKSGYYNYIKGNDRSKWKGHVPVFSELSSDELYAGIKMRVYGTSGSFKYDYLVDPDADASQIAFLYSGTDGISVEKDRIVIRTSVGDLYESIPVSYQLIDGERVEVKCRYIQNEDYIGFQFPKGYDTSIPLIIDPVLVASTLSGTGGSGGTNFGHGATYDLAGNIYTHAISFDSAYPTDEGSFQEVYGGGGTDAAISKLTPDGSDLIYATFIGGNQGENPHSTIVNGNEEIYVFGTTSSPDFPTSNGAFQEDFGGGSDIFVTGLSADGSELVGSTYIGGSAADGTNNLGGGYDTYRGEINSNLNGEIYISSCSSSDDFPATAGTIQPDKNSGQDGVLVKLNSDLSEILWATFIGSEVDDMAYGVRIKDDQTVLVSGAVGGNSSGGSGDDFVTTPGAFQETFGGGSNDAFVTHLSEDGASIIASTFLGIDGNDKGLFMDVDSDDDVWIYMESSSDWTVTDNVWGVGGGNVIVHKLSGDLSELLITSYLTDLGSANGTPVAFMVDLCNGIYISAYGTGGGGFQASDDALFQSGGFYLGVFAPDMSDLTYGTYYTENHVDGGTSRFDKQGIVYQGVCSGGGFNTTDDAWAPNQATGWDIGVFKIDFEIQSVNAIAGAAGQLSGCAPHTVSFDNFSTGVDFEWLFGDGNSSDEFEPEHLYEIPGDYIVSLIVYDPLSCNLRDTAYIPITVFPEVVFFAEFDYTLDCETGEIILTNESSGPADIEYEWDMGDGSTAYDENPVHLYDNPGTYTVVLVASSDACNQEMEFELEVLYEPEIIADFGVQVIDICDALTIEIYNQSASVVDYSWNMDDGTVLTTSDASFEYEFAAAGTYEITLIVTNDLSCNLADTLTQTIVVDPTPELNPVITSGQTGYCEDLEFDASVQIDGVFATITWMVDEEEVGNTPSISGIVDDGGIQNITVIVTDPICNFEFTAVMPQQFYEYLGFNLDPTSYLCYHDESLVLNSTVPYDATYSWTPGDSEEPVLIVEKPDDYEVTVGYNGCIEVQSTNVLPGNEYPLSFESVICAGYSNTVLFPENNLIESVNWADGQTGLQIEVSWPGNYPFTAIDIFGCNQIDSLLAIARDDDPNIIVPNIFTPNNDGFNDVFEIHGEEIVAFNLKVYNRWGKMVFESDEIYGTWDGKYDGSDNDGSDGTYFYVLTYRDYCDLDDQVKSGYLTAAR